MRHLLVALLALTLAACGDSPVGKYVFANKEVQSTWADLFDDFSWEFRDNGHYYINNNLAGKWIMDKGVVSIHLLDGTLDNVYEMQGDQLVSVLMPGHMTLVRAD